MLVSAMAGWKGKVEGRVQTFGGLRVLFVQEPATVPPIEHGGEAPWALLKRLHILDLYDEDVTWLCALDLERAGEVVYTGQVAVLDIVGAIVVHNLATGPVYALDLDSLAWDDLADKWD